MMKIYTKKKKEFFPLALFLDDEVMYSLATCSMH